MTVTLEVKHEIEAVANTEAQEASKSMSDNEIRQKRMEILGRL